MTETPQKAIFFQRVNTFPLQFINHGDIKNGTSLTYKTLNKIILVATFQIMRQKRQKR